MMPRYRFYIILIVLFILYASSFAAVNAQKTFPVGHAYTLTDLYKSALTYAKKVQISLKDLEMAENLRKKALSVLKPRITAFGNYTRYSEEKRYQNTLLQPKWKTNWGFRLDQSFTLNGKELIALRITEDGIKKGEWDFNTVKEAYLLSVAVAYYDVLKAQKKIEIVRSDVERMSKHQESVSIRLKIEDVTKTALYRADAQLSQSKTNLIRAINWLRLKRTILANLADLPHDYKIGAPEDNYEDREINFTQLKQRALNHRSELISMALQKEIAEKRIKLTRSDYWPKITLEGVYLNNDQGPSSNMGYDDSVWLGVNLEFRLFDGGLRKIKIMDELIKKKKVELNIQAMADRIVEEVEQAYLDYITQKSILKSLRDQYRSSRENYDAVMKQFKYGLATNLDVIDANALLSASEGQFSEAEYNYRLALLKIGYTSGDLLKNIINNP